MKRWGLLVVLLLALCGCAGGGASRGTNGTGAYAGKLVKQYGGEKTRPDALPVRTIVLTYPKAGERLNLTYYKNGDYDPEAMHQIDMIFRDRNVNKVGQNRSRADRIMI